ncbi:unnamed protein product [Eruca vesicaria subsp. sativa]|uniref:Uncharacterized protein n=1 Tax=Eruca vesicaria subsp. sativa TaxID=29727 RepID=A0ABC8ISU9_ERUVS|nr:unnamed protein product [Eruca vesicaria subsp. sativa]
MMFSRGPLGITYHVVGVIARLSKDLLLCIVTIRSVKKYLTKISVYDKCEQTIFTNVDARADHFVPVPEDLLAAIGKTFKFIVKVSEHNFTGKTQSITVTKILAADAPPPNAPMEDEDNPEATDDILKIGSGGAGPSGGGQTLEGQLTNDSGTTEQRFLTVGDAYEFAGFSVAHNFRGQKFTQLPYFIRINQETTMINVTGIGPIFPIHNFSALKYSSLLRLADTPSYFPAPNEKVTIGLLLNKWKMVKLKLWGKQAADFNTIQIEKDMMLKVVIITSVIPKFVKEKLELSSSPATDFYFDKSIGLIKNFKGRVRRPRRG